MIPVLLERAIMKGWATYSKWTHALGMFGELTIPDNKTVIIVDIKWHHFMNPYRNTSTVTWNEWWKYNEYQMKIDGGGKSENFMTFRNRVNIVPQSGAYAIVKTGQITTAQAQIANYIPDPPIQQDVYFICEKFVRVTISRNVYFDSPASNYGLLDPIASEQSAPNGIQNVNVLKRLTGNSAVDFTQMFFNPPGNQNSGLGSAGDREVQNYTQDISRDAITGNCSSEIYPPDVGFNATLNKPTVTQPLVEFGIVTINSNDFNKLGNS